MLKVVDDLTESEVTEIMATVGTQARVAARELATASTEQKNQALKGMAEKISRSSDEILSANAIDVDNMKSKQLAEAFIDRGTLSAERINEIVAGIKSISALEDPIGAVMASWTRPNGLKIDRVRTPLGVIGVIYESRPNVTADAGSLCLKAGNSVILRGGSDTHQTATAIHTCLQQGLESAEITKDAIQLVPTVNRAAVGEMLKGLSGNIDVIVPRGGKNLVERVENEARVPVFAHLEGIVHVYIHQAANFETAQKVTLNSKMRRTGICGAAETILIDNAITNDLLPQLVSTLRESGCFVKGDDQCRTIVSDLESATEEDWRTEYLDSVISIRTVNGLEEAMAHIATYGSSHTDCIITEDQKVAKKFMSEVDSAIVIHNASTQFADGGEFGMGAEIGIATGRMHARGPVGVEQLTSFKYCVSGNGQTRT